MSAPVSGAPPGIEKRCPGTGSAPLSLQGIQQTTNEKADNRFAPMPQGFGFGPWVHKDPIEHTAEVRELRAVAKLILGARHPLFGLLSAAVADPAALVEAEVAIRVLPALQRRRLLASAGALWAPGRRA